MPMSSICRAKMSLNSTIVASRVSRSVAVICESVHLNIEKNLTPDSSFCVGSIFSSSDSSRNFLRIRFCIGEWSTSLPGCSGVGNQNFSSLSSGRSTCIKALMYVTTSSWLGRRLSAAMSTGRIFLVSFRICNSASFVSAFIV